MELVRQPVYLLLLTVSGLFIVFLSSVSYFGLGDDVKLVKDMALAVILISGLVGAVLCAASSVAQEIRSGTVLTVMAKPVDRSTFLLGKFAGLAGVLTLLTVHNLAFQGVFPADVLKPLKLPVAAGRLDGMEYWGKVSFLKAAVKWATHVSTVSPTYAREITSPAQGMGLDPLLRLRDLVMRPNLFENLLQVANEGRIHKDSLYLLSRLFERRVRKNF
mgnify:CR=1 FL=1